MSFKHSVSHGDNTSIGEDCLGRGKGGWR